MTRRLVRSRAVSAAAARVASRAVAEVRRSRAAAARAAPAKSRKIRWANEAGGRLTDVRVLPSTDERGLDPGYVERKQRIAALRKIHGIRALKKKLDEQWGEDGERGTRGRYTPQMARRNLWHQKTYKQPWYTLQPQENGRMFFGRPDKYDAKWLKKRMAKRYEVTRTPSYYPGVSLADA